MKKTVIKISCALSVCWTPQLLFAAGESGSRGVETTGGSPQPSVNQGANQTSSSNSLGKVMSYLTGGMLVTQGYMDITAGQATCGAAGGCNYPLIAKGVLQVGMGVLSFAQGGAHGGSAGQANITGIQSNGFGNDPGMGSMDPTDPYNPNSPLGQDPYVKSGLGNLAKLEKAGILDMKKGTITAGGKTYKVSDFGSTAGMASAGYSKGAIDGAMAYADAIGKKAAEKAEKMKLGSMTASTGYEEGGGSGAGSASGSDSSSGSDYAAAGGSGGIGAGLGRDPSSLAGMQKNYNGEPIGVAADSIFLMMNRRYKVKESQESFFTDAELALQK